MAAIRPRKRADGTISYTAQIRIKKDGVQVYTESQTFARKKAAEAWVSRSFKKASGRFWRCLKLMPATISLTHCMSVFSPISMRALTRLLTTALPISPC